MSLTDDEEQMLRGELDELKKKLSGVWAWAEKYGNGKVCDGTNWECGQEALCWGCGFKKLKEILRDEGGGDLKEGGKRVLSSDDAEVQSPPPSTGEEGDK